MFIVHMFVCLSINIFLAGEVSSRGFILTSDTYEQNTRSASHGLLTKPSRNTSKYSNNAFAASVIFSWNFFQRLFSNNNLCQLSYSQIKVLIKNYLSDSYNQEYD